jgi:hypothetical protein
VREELRGREEKGQLEKADENDKRKRWNKEKRRRGRIML